MISVLDTSASVELILGRPECAKIQEILVSSKLGVCPDLYSAEITNVFSKLFKAGEVSHEYCERGIDQALSLVDNVVLMAEFSQEVFAAAIAYKSTGHDLYYAVTSRRYNAILLTIDKKLKETAKKMDLRL